MAIYEIAKEKLIEFPKTTFSSHGVQERHDLQRLIRDQIEILADDVLIVCEEFCDWEDSKRRIDLLGIDRQANLVVVELKRSDDGGHMELQAIRYAAMVSKMTFEHVVEVFSDYLIERSKNEDAREQILQFLAWDSPDEEKFGQDVRIILASAEFSRELTSSVLWLNEHGLDIRCVRLRPHTDGKRLLLDVQQVLPLPEASEYFVNLRDKKAEERQSRNRAKLWSGLWFVNIGMDDKGLDFLDDNGKRYQRHWENCVRYGYVAAGGGPKYSEPLKKLEPGDYIMAYQKGRGYLGYGMVTQSAMPLHEFTLSDGTRLAENVQQKKLNANRPQEEWEYVIGVEWKKHFRLEEAQTFKGVFANQNIVCKLSHPATVKFVRERFEIADVLAPSTEQIKS
jgi:hypothetical protein